MMELLAAGMHHLTEEIDRWRAIMNKTFKRGDHVRWNSEAGRVCGTIQRKVTSGMIFKGYKRRASKDDPQYIIKSDTTDHLAIHKGSALTRIPKKAA